MLRKISFIYSLEDYDERILSFPEKWTQIIWFYLFGHVAGVFGLLLAIVLSILIWPYKLAAKMVHQIDVIMIPAP
jgi:hypothetical protein